MLKFFICFIAGIGAGLGTGFAGMSAAAVISPNIHCIINNIYLLLTKGNRKLIT